MQKILILGAGRSATDLIEYLLQHSAANQWEVTVADMSLELAQHKVQGYPQGKAIALDGSDEEARRAHIAVSDVVVSLLPPPMHPAIARDCLDLGKHLVTASYVSAEMAALDEEARAKGLIFLNELGADPGIDHLSVMRGLDKIHAKGGKVLSLKSYCGSLVAPESNTNPWGYKFTWSPMNVILAGQNAACYQQNGKRVFLPYNRIFSTTTKVEIEGVGTFEGYANRDSYSYLKTYNLPEVDTLIRGTLRYDGYCEAWNAFIQLGLTANEYKIEGSENISYAEWLASYLSDVQGESLEAKVAKFLGTSIDSPLMQRLIWAGLFSEEKIGKKNASPAEILLERLMGKWVFEDKDKDMLVMADIIRYEWQGKVYEKTATLVTLGIDHEHTAISRTVGLPCAMGVKLLLQGKISQKGVLIPIHAEIYEPILAELAELGIAFSENIREC